MKFQLLKSPFESEFRAAVRQVRREFVFSSPYINDAGVSILLDAIEDAKTKRLNILTNLSSRNLADNVTQPSALLKLYDAFAETTVSSLAKLHAKVYIVDENYAMITSANLTYGGLKSNFEYGILINEIETIRAVKRDVLEYAALGHIFDKSILAKIEEKIKNITRIKTKQERQQNSALEKLLLESVQKIESELLKDSIKGSSRNQVFVKTITYLLAKHGRLKLKPIYDFIKEIHPDLCNDAVFFQTFGDKHYGKNFGVKWEHDVRSALYTYLMRKGIVGSEGTGKRGETEFFLIKPQHEE